MSKLLQINAADNVAVVLDRKPLACDVQNAPDAGNAPVGHKVALRDIAEGEAVIKYGFPIGHATQPIKAGEWVHSHNLATSLGENLDYSAFAPDNSDYSINSDNSNLTIDTYVRKNGEMGIRNELWVVPTVGCVNSQALAIAERLRAEGGCADDVRAFTHNYGCSQLGQDHANTRAALCSLIKHPNAGGVIVLGLGCENNQIGKLRESLGEYDEERVKFIVAQEVDDEIEEGVALGRELLALMSADRRQPLPVSMLRVGLKCGGSDGLSGITANPLVGAFSDWLVAHGGSTVLTEVPEMFGAETILMRRCVDRPTFDKTVALINDFKDYFRASGQPIYENPSPGNKEGGITTLEEKSLGCVQKGGTAPVTDVLQYAQRIAKQGLNLLCAPGNDLVASTALALSGCQMVLFTTGRGTPFGTFVPTLKISTNTPLATKKPRWIDFNAGALLSDDCRVATCGDQAPHPLLNSLIDKVLATANGTLALNEQAGAKEIAIFKSGVTL